MTKCSLRTFVVRAPGNATVITQDIRRRHQPVTGSYDIAYPQDQERKLIRHLGCTFVARVKPEIAA